MIRKYLPFVLSLLFTGTCLSVCAQQSGATVSSDWPTWLIIGLVALIFLAIYQVTDNSLTLSGQDKNVKQAGMLPAVSQILPKKRPAFVGENEDIHYLYRGHNISLKGKSDPTVEDVTVTRFALQPPNFNGIAPIPKLVVDEGDEVKAGDPVFYDKSAPSVFHVAPVSGEVIAVNRGEKRSIVEVVILADKEIKYREYEPVDYTQADRETLVNFLADSGVWALINQRPYDIVPDLEEVPRDIFISTFDTAPLGPDLNLVVEGREELFQEGLNVLTHLTDGDVHLGLNAGAKTPPSQAFIQAAGVKKHWFKGPHPAGNVGVQIHHINPILPGDKVWTLGVQEVITLGALFVENRFHSERVIALSGAELKRPHYVRTNIGAHIGELLDDNEKEGELRYISGDVLSGEQKRRDGFVNSRDDQITVVKEGDYYEIFGWLIPQKLRPTVSHTFPNFMIPGLKFRADTNTHGERRAFVVTGQYEKLLPMDVYVQALMKAIMINDFELMEGLGIHELSEEDVALCEFACTSKQPLQRILREGLDVMYEQG